ncbi:MAG: hypothetical protein COA86_18920 [Kangiella sp.]|nr:MAG: hypothetical protein COA86_18920 [Kangiella sp.]
MRILILVTLLIAPNLSYGKDSCIFGPCKPVKPPTALEIETLEKVFKQTKYLLAAAYNSQAKRYHPNVAYKNIPDWDVRTKKLRSDINKLIKQAKTLNPQLGGGDIEVALSNTLLCVSFAKTYDEFCTVALNGLKSWLWDKEFGTNWADFDYDYKGDYIGLPKHLIKK